MIRRSQCSSILYSIWRHAISFFANINPSVIVIWSKTFNNYLKILKEKIIFQRSKISERPEWNISETGSKLIFYLSLWTSTSSGVWQTWNVPILRLNSVWFRIVVTGLFWLIKLFFFISICFAFATSRRFCRSLLLFWLWFF